MPTNFDKKTQLLNLGYSYGEFPEIQLPIVSDAALKDAEAMYRTPRSLMFGFRQLIKFAELPTADHLKKLVPFVFGQGVGGDFRGNEFEAAYSRGVTLLNDLLQREPLEAILCYWLFVVKLRPLLRLNTQIAFVICNAALVSRRLPHLRISPENEIYYTSIKRAFFETSDANELLLLLLTSLVPNVIVLNRIHDER